VQHRLGDKSFVGDARHGFKERPHVLLKKKTRGSYSR
jgi:hypothetical protein